MEGEKVKGIGPKEREQKRKKKKKNGNSGRKGSIKIKERKKVLG